MSTWPVFPGGQRFIDEGMSTGATTGTALSHSGTAHTKGVYTQLVASSPFAAVGFLLHFADDAALTGRSYLVDIAVGGAGSEQVIAPNILIDCASLASRVNGVVSIPLAIPAGTRISARFQNSSTTGTLAVGIILTAGGLFGSPSAARMTAMGPDTATSNALVIDPGAVAHTKGSYGQLSASAAHDMRAIIIAIGSNKNTAPGITKWLLDIAVGAAASEQVVISNFLFICGGDRQLPALFGPIPCMIPAGTRVAARAQCGITDATDRKFALAVYGLG